MKAHAVIDANYGDSAKGMFTDFLCSVLAPDCVIRHSSGANSGHTVVTPTGQRHVFHHYGAGSFLGVPTFLSKYFISNPILFAKEEFPKCKVYVDPKSIVTTPMDMLVNQAYEQKLGRHASCGVGINETVRRSLDPAYRLTVDDILDRVTYEKILNEYVPKRLAQLDLDLVIENKWEQIFYDFAYAFLDRIIITAKPPGTNFVFEGSQGLKLDAKSRDFPYVTHARTGMCNVFQICADWGIDDLRATYVTRSYLTRHGAGPLTNEATMPTWVKDETNITHPFQGALRYAPLDLPHLEMRIIDDAKGIPFDLAVTCQDQFEYPIGQFTLPIGYTSWGPTRATMEVQNKPVRKRKVNALQT